jgi:hypothetical protein
MTLIEFRPHPWGWTVFEAPGVEPVFLKKDQAIDYGQNRMLPLRSDSHCELFNRAGIARVWRRVRVEVSQGSYFARLAH